MKEVAEVKLGKKVTKAVITVPASTSTSPGNILPVHERSFSKRNQIELTCSYQLNDDQNLSLPDL